MIGHHFNKYDPNEQGKTRFEQLLDIFMQLLTYTNGDVAEALQWLNQLDREYLVDDLSQDGGLVAASGTDFKYSGSSFKVQFLSHRGDYIWLRNSLVVSD